jgi:hypothetical protein
MSTNTAIDEPTSGLDSQTAWSICMLMRKLVDNGQTILCTIHQPSAQIFDQFDRLLFLKDGATLYFGDIGEDASVLTNYFEQRGSRKCHPGENPAEWLLDVTNSPSKGINGDFWAQEWASSPERETALKKLSEFEAGSKRPLPEETLASCRDRSEFASPFHQQFILLVKRLALDQWRNPHYLYAKTAVCVGLVCFRSLLNRLPSLLGCFPSLSNISHRSNVP